MKNIMRDYKDLEKDQIKFKNLELLDNAFVHRSYVNEHKKEDIEDNERLEFWECCFGIGSHKTFV